MNEPVNNPRSRLARDAVKLAAEILSDSRENESPIERSRSSLMARMMDDQAGKKFTIAMADQVLRMRRPDRAADRMDSLLEEYGLPKYFTARDRLGLRIGNLFAGWFPRLVMPLVKSKVRHDSAHVIIAAEDAEFTRYLAERKRQGIRVNFNQLGEAVLGEREANHRLQQYLRRLRNPGIEYCSVKLSSVVSKISLTGYEQTLDNVRERLRTIYRAAIEGGGSAGPKFVNLDMEEYRDLHLTVDTFRAVLDEPEFEKLLAGIVLQAYLPDSFAVLKTLTAWASERFRRTGGGIKIRLVKGANLAMEQVEASLHDWPLATYDNKPDVDANYKRMLEFATRREHAEFLRVGIASHNLFDVAYAMLLRQNSVSPGQFEFEMLEGMANAQALEVRERTGDLIVYSPVCFEHEFESAVAYLVRRLDENTAPGSFLGALFALQEGTPDWIEQRDAFLKACQRAHDPDLSATPSRTQNRLTETIEIAETGASFANAADTDFSLPANRQWIKGIFADWQDRKPEPVPIQIAGRELIENRLTGRGQDPSRPGYQAYQFAQGNADDVEVALQTAVAAQIDWEQLGVQQRGKILRQAAVIMAQQRGEAIGTMLIDAGKTATEADVEISEAVDFANYYSYSLDHDGWFDGSVCRAAGIVVVTPPWNFPYAIPAGGVLAALMAGNAVILKPARESVLTAWKLATQLWAAGIPREALQFLPLVDGATGKRLITDPRVAAVILTGSSFTANMFLSWRPDLKLLAETSGKNSMIISVAADIDLAIRDLIKGAFGHAGQKCSATSLALVQKDVYDNPRFMEQLKDAAESLLVAGSWNAAADVTPVIRQPDEYLERGLKELDEGESWLLEPQMIDENPCLWRPGIRLGVKPGGWYHCHECFGPVLGLIRVENFEQAIEIQNSSDFGLTGGLHSLDPKEVALWRERVEVGNAYINRSTSGAIVQRQPFGGWKDSCVGPGAKAGGPNYVAALCHWTSWPRNAGPRDSANSANSANRENSDSACLPSCAGELTDTIANMITQLKSTGLEAQAMQRLTAAAKSYSYWWQHEFSIERDPSQIHGETNHFRYRPRPWHVIRFSAAADFELETAALACIACRTGGVPLEFSLSEPIKMLDAIVAQPTQVIVETETELSNRLASLRGGTLRIIGDFNLQTLSPANIGNIPFVRAEVMLNGRVELLNYLREQSVSEIVHRYGNLV